MGVVRILFLSDTHLGFDWPLRPRIQRRRRGPDFFRNYERALEPARRGEVDCVVHGGDILYRSKVPPMLVEMAFEPLKTLADEGVPIYIVPGNHERSVIPRGLLAQHPGIQVFDRPQTYLLHLDGFSLGLSGFPCILNNVRTDFTTVVEATGWRNARAHGYVLCMHQAVDGAVVGPADFMFKNDKDVVRPSDIPAEFGAALSGHIHRFQVLTKDLHGDPLDTPIFYPGSIERTSFAEKDEKKGYLILELEIEDGESRIHNWCFHELPTRPMVRVDLDARRMLVDFEGALRTVLDKLPKDGIVSLRFHGPLGEEALSVLRAPSLRSIAPTTMNVSVKYVNEGASTRAHKEKSLSEFLSS